MTYENSINWELEPINPPPLLRPYTDEEILNYHAPLDISQVHSNSQAVEGAVQLMNLVAKKVVPAKRISVAKLTMASRKKFSRFNSKKDFYSNAFKQENIMESSKEINESENNDDDDVSEVLKKNERGENLENYLRVGNNELSNNEPSNNELSNNELFFYCNVNESDFEDE